MPQKSLNSSWRKSWKHLLVSEHLTSLPFVENEHLQPHLRMAWTHLAKLYLKEEVNKEYLNIEDPKDPLSVLRHSAEFKSLASSESKYNTVLDEIEQVFAAESHVDQLNWGPDAVEKHIASIRTFLTQARVRLFPTFIDTLLHTKLRETFFAIFAFLLLGVAIYYVATALLAPDFEVALNSQEYGSFYVNRNVNNKPIKVGGKEYKRGLGTHANSEILVTFNRTGEHFSGKVGVDDQVGEMGSVVFKIFSEDNLLWESPVLRAGMPAEDFSVDVRKIPRLRLVANSANDGINFDHANWLELTLN